MATKKPTYKAPEAYKSQYSDQIASGMEKVTNREAFSYDPLKDANYQAMAKIYNQQGNKAAKDTMGDAASLNGGYGSSYAVTASQQVRSDYNQQLASQIPALQEAAYSKYKDAYDMDVTNLQLLQDADNMAYGRYRDNVGDKQWKYDTDYQAYRDTVGDKQWQKSYNRSVYESDRDYKYQKSRDKVADSQWAKEFALAKKGKSTSGRSSSSGYIGGSSGGNGGYVNSGSSNYEKAKGDARSGTSSGNSSGNSSTKNKSGGSLWDRLFKNNSRTGPIAGGGR